jgi:hypothetical protein
MKTNDRTDLQARLITCAMLKKEHRQHYIEATATAKPPVINMYRFHTCYFNQIPCIDIRERYRAYGIFLIVEILAGGGNNITAFKINLIGQLSLYKSRVSLFCLHSVASLMNRQAWSSGLFCLLKNGGWFMVSCLYGFKPS